MESLAGDIQRLNGLRPDDSEDKEPVSKSHPQKAAFASLAPAPQIGGNSTPLKFGRLHRFGRDRI